MTQHTAEAFADARFATHPDGRIAARIDPEASLPWFCAMSEFPLCQNDADMAADGWSPLDETRPPGVVTDEDDMDCRPCTSEHDDFTCSREYGHDGPHVAATTNLDHAVCEVWDDRPMTSREHLDAAWSAAHVPADGIIPAGVAFIERAANGSLIAYPDGAMHAAEVAEQGGYERRLLDPPAPARPDGAEAVEALITEYHEAGDFILTGKLNGAPLADFLAERGVRAPEDGAS